MIELRWLTAESVQHFAERMRPWLQIVVDQHPDGAYTIEGIMYKLYRGEWICWVVLEDEVVVGVTATVTTPDMKARNIVRILFLAGVGWLKWGPRVLAEFEAMAASKDIHSVEFVGREGFARTLPDYQRVGIIYRKVVRSDAPQLDSVKPNVFEVGTA